MKVCILGRQDYSSGFNLVFTEVSVRVTYYYFSMELLERGASEKSWSASVVEYLEALIRMQAITPHRYDEATITRNHNAAIGERGYHTTSPPSRAVYADFLKKKLRHEHKPFRESGESIEDAALHNQPPRL